MNKLLYLPFTNISAAIALVWSYALFTPNPARATLSRDRDTPQALIMPTPGSLVDRHHPKSVTIAKYVRPKTADNGSPFPKNSGYVKGYPIQFKNGLSSVTVDNSRTSSDIFVKLYALDATPPQAVRVFFIRAGKKFTTQNIKPGNYDIRYRDLNDGRLLRTDPFNLEESKDFNGSTKFIKYTLILKSIKGNIKTHPISETEF